MSELRITPTSDPYSWLVNGTFSIHDFANDPDFHGLRAADRWGYYLPDPWPGWVYGFDTFYAAAEAGVAAIKEGPMNVVVW